MNLITEDDLKSWTGYTRRADIENWLREQRIPFVFGKQNRLCTTQDAIDRALSGDHRIAANQEDSFF